MVVTRVFVPGTIKGGGCGVILVRKQKPGANSSPPISTAYIVGDEDEDEVGEEEEMGGVSHDGQCDRSCIYIGTDFSTSIAYFVRRFVAFHHNYSHRHCYFGLGLPRSLPHHYVSRHTLKSLFLFSVVGERYTDYVAPGTRNWRPLGDIRGADSGANALESVSRRPLNGCEF